MPKFAANLSMLFTERPFLDRFEAAAAAGFEAVEFLFPYDWPVDEIRARLVGNGLRLVLHNLPPGDWSRGERGLASLPDRVGEFRASVDRALAYATALGAPQLHCLSGIPPRDADPAQVHRTYLDNLRYTAAALQREGIRALIEPINRFDIPGIHLHRPSQAIAVLDEAACDNLWLQYDLYHAQRTEGELVATLERWLPRIAHLQVADTPGRHEPGTGEVNWDFVFAQVDRLGYAGWIGCEYHPAATTEAGLGWLARARGASA